MFPPLVSIRNFTIILSLRKCGFRGKEGLDFEWFQGNKGVFEEDILGRELKSTRTA